MITNNGSCAVNLSNIKGIRKEYEPQGGLLVFDLDDIVVLVENPQTGEKELRSFPNSPIKMFYDSKDALQAYFEEWAELWSDFMQQKD